MRLWSIRRLRVRSLQNAAIQLNLHLAVSAEAFNGVNLINDLSSE